MPCAVQGLGLAMEKLFAAAASGEKDGWSLQTQLALEQCEPA